MLERDWQRAARFFRIHAITEGQFRSGVPVTEFGSERVPPHFEIGAGEPVEALIEAPSMPPEWPVHLRRPR
jgi:hypothetical protein